MYSIIFSTLITFSSSFFFIIKEVKSKAFLSSFLNVNLKGKFSLNLVISSVAFSFKKISVNSLFINSINSFIFSLLLKHSSILFFNSSSTTGVLLMDYYLRVFSFFPKIYFFYHLNYQ